MLIQTGLRTDIPAYYAKWLMNRFREGYALVRSPYDTQRVLRYQLSPDVVDAVGFCTKNPAPMLPHVPQLRSYGQFWFVTITPYGRDIEPNVPDKRQVLASVQVLSRLLGRECVQWRYDPILLSDEWTVERHLREFETMCEQLATHVSACVISFIDLYEKVKRNFPEVRAVTQAEQMQLGEGLSRIARKHHLPLKACCEGRALETFGIDCDGCMTLKTYEQALKIHLTPPRKLPVTQRGCACVLQSDLGAYNTCGHLCRYCYANSDAEAVRENMRRHDPDSPLLIGHPMKQDVVCPAHQESWRDGQMQMDDWWMW